MLYHWPLNCFSRRLASEHEDTNLMTWESSKRDCDGLAWWRFHLSMEDSKTSGSPVGGSREPKDRWQYTKYVPCSMIWILPRSSSTSTPLYDRDVCASADQSLMICFTVRRKRKFMNTNKTGKVQKQKQKKTLWRVGFLSFRKTKTRKMHFAATSTTHRSEEFMTCTFFS